MSEMTATRVYLLGPSPGTHTERVQLLQSLSATGYPVYVSAQRRALYLSSLKHPYLDEQALFGEQLHTLDDERVTRGVISRSVRALRVETPWAWHLNLRQLPETTLELGPFKVCFDDSLLGDPMALLLHSGLTLTYSASLPALTLPTEGPLRVVLLEVVEHDGRERLSVSALGASHQLIGGPWWITP